MKKIVPSLFLFLILLGPFYEAKAENNRVVVDRMFLSKFPEQSVSNSNLPMQHGELFTNEDKIISYHVDIGVINPTKKYYEIEFICIDRKGNEVIKKNFKQDISLFTQYSMGKDILRKGVVSLTLNPTPDFLVEDQRIVLQNKKDYFVKFYVEKELVGISRFHYQIQDLKEMN